jgi:hypothetical protein
MATAVSATTGMARELSRWKATLERGNSVPRIQVKMSTFSAISKVVTAWAAQVPAIRPTLRNLLNPAPRLRHHQGLAPTTPWQTETYRYSQPETMKMYAQFENIGGGSCLNREIDGIQLIGYHKTIFTHKTIFMRKKAIVIAIIVILAILFGGMFWYGKKVQEKQKTDDMPVSNQQQDQRQTPAEEKFVTDVDPDVNHWQTKETEYFTIKFPKEWYWLEPDPRETEYRSQVITNNPNFQIDRYPDISVFTGGAFQFSSDDKKHQSLPLNPSEVVITTSGLGGVTSNSGTPREFMDGEITRLKRDLYPEMKCHYTSSLNSIPLTAFCSFLDSNGQIVDTYYVSHPKRTFAYTARITQENSIKENMEYILEHIAESMVPKKDF